MSFIKLFKNDFIQVEQLLRNRIWFGILQELATNNRMSGDVITFQEFTESYTGKLLKERVELFVETVLKESELLALLKTQFNNMCQLNVLLKGFKVKCPNCASRFWYHLNEIQDKVICKGCLEVINFPIELPFSYKLNDLIRNNLWKRKYEAGSQSNSGLKDIYDGNLAVILTLAFLSKGANSFEYSAQVNIFGSTSYKIIIDLDIVCQIDGKLIIGESKINSAGFFENNFKSIKRLVGISKHIRPDKILV